MDPGLEGVPVPLRRARAGCPAVHAAAGLAGHAGRAAGGPRPRPRATTPRAVHGLRVEVNRPRHGTRPRPCSG
jgi:hypothetical protein